MKALTIGLIVAAGVLFGGCGPDAQEHAAWARQICKGHGGIRYSDPGDFFFTGFVVCADDFKTYNAG